MSPAVADREHVLHLLADVRDPELPFVDVVELGIVRDVIFDHGVEVVITPTYSGCPAMQVIERDIVARLAREGYGDVRLRTVYSPPWSSEWLTDGARRKFREAGIAPPRSADMDLAGIEELVSIRRSRPAAECPYCGSSNTEQRSEFGSTACKAIHFCNSCRQPFDRFKAI